MNVARAILTALVLLVVSIVGIVAGGHATDPVVVAGGVGVIVATALLSLTILAARWRHGTRGYDSTPMSAQRPAPVEDLSSTFGVKVPTIELTTEDSAAV